MKTSELKTQPIKINKLYINNIQFIPNYKQLITGSYTSSIHDELFIDTSNSSFSIALINSSSLEEMNGIEIFDYKSTFSSSNLIINGNGNLINYQNISSSQYTCNEDNSHIKLIWNNENWELYK